MSSLSIYVWASPTHHESLRVGIHAPGLKDVQLDIGEILTPALFEAADLCILWPEEGAVTKEHQDLIDSKKAQTIFIGDKTPDSTAFYACMRTPVRLGLLADHVRRFFNKDQTVFRAGDIVIGSCVLKPREMLFIQQDTGKEQILTEKERDILYALFEAGPQGISRQALLDKVWAYVEGVETHTLETHIYRLRQKIEADPAAPALLINQDGVYILSCFTQI